MGTAWLGRVGTCVSRAFAESLAKSKDVSAEGWFSSHCNSLYSSVTLARLHHFWCNPGGWQVLAMGKQFMYVRYVLARVSLRG